MMDRLHKFAVLIDEGSFTAAAQRLHTSQPALSIAIAKLEQELRVKLLVRGSRPISLTQAGIITYDSAKELEIMTQNLTVKLADLSHQRLSLILGMIDSIAALFLTNNLLRELEHAAKTSVIVNNSRYLLRAIEHDELDIAFVTEQPNSPSKLIRQEYVATEPLVLVVHHQQVNDTQADLSRGTIRNFISYDQPSNSYQLIKKSLEQKIISVSPAFFSTSVEVMLHLTLMQQGVAVLPYLSVKKFVTGGELSLLGLPYPMVIDRRIYALTRRDKHNSRLLRVVTHQLGQILSGYYQEAVTLGR